MRTSQDPTNDIERGSMKREEPRSRTLASNAIDLPYGDRDLRKRVRDASARPTCRLVTVAEIHERQCEAQEADLEIA